MDRIWQWAWNRYGAWYSWAIFAIAILVVLPPYLLVSFIVLNFENSGHYVHAVVAAVIAALVICYYAFLLAGRGRFGLIEQWAAGYEVGRAEALEATYTYARGAFARTLAGNTVVAAALLLVVDADAGATASRLVQWGIIGACIGISVSLIGGRSFIEVALRPVRAAIASDTGIGDSLPRSKPTFATWSNLAVVTVAFLFTGTGALLAGVFNRINEFPVLCVVIGCGMTLGFMVPITVGTAFSPSLRPIRDLSEGTERVAAGDYSQRLPVVQDDDLGALAASFNRMQAGLVERQRLQGAFGTYVDPVLASRLLQQGDDVFTGERRLVTVMFVDIRDFTPFAEANTAEDTEWRASTLSSRSLCPSSSAPVGTSTSFSATGHWRSSARPTTWQVMLTQRCPSPCRFNVSLKSDSVVRCGSAWVSTPVW
jgi:adenylate cyclase